MKNDITADDVETIYKKVEKTKKGTFFIDKSDKKIEPTPNHIDKEVAAFLEKIPDDKIREDGNLARRIAKGLINE